MSGRDDSRAPAEVELSAMEINEFGDGFFSVDLPSGSHITIRLSDWTPEFKTALLRAVEDLLNERLSQIGGRVIVTRLAEPDEDDE